MASNRVVAVLLIFALVMSMNVEEVKCESFWKEFVAAFKPVPEKERDPAKDSQYCMELICMPKCMALSGATTQVCTKECTSVCRTYRSS
uniref:Thionin-like protein 2 n=1 Tax=Nelumbo nucifera TaxID=4432 RepID=A0A822YAT5_NELNU|nr:TPA_asm: hypothetical protein HUJ06_031005 [Nelumbo nucifera]